MNIDVYNFITSNLKIKHKYFKGLNFDLISNFAQCNLKFHPPYPNVCNTHDEIVTIFEVTMLVPTVKIETLTSMM
jgi:hypothetical protein